MSGIDLPLKPDPREWVSIRMTAMAIHSIPDHVDFLVLQPDQERAIVRDLTFAVLAFNVHDPSAPLQLSFPLYADPKVALRGVLGPCVRVTGPAEKLYVLTLRHEVAGHLRAGRAMTLVRDRVVTDVGRSERFTLVSAKRGAGATLPTGGIGTGPRPLVLSGQSRLIETAGRLGVDIRDEAAFVARTETAIPSDGTIDPLGFSERKTLPVLR